MDSARPARRWQTGFIIVLLTASVAAAYAPTLWHGFVDYDDNLYITENSIVQRGLTWPGVQWAFTSFEASNWHPLTWLSHMLDCQMYRRADGSQWAGGHHLTNLVFHFANTLILFALLRGMTRAPWRSALVAALFALHPLHVESVAWVAERKDVLSTCFGLLTLWTYAAYAQRPSLARYALVMVCFALSLLAKPMLVTMPFVLLLLDLWPLNRWQMAQFTRDLSASRVPLGRLILEKLPLAALALASCVITIIAQRRGGAVFPLEALPLPQRFANAIVAYGSYIAKTFWPVDLAVLYPHPGRWPMWRIVLTSLVLTAITACAVALRRKRPYLLVGWLWYLGTLMPVIGLVQVGMQSMADRYTYVPLVGLFIMISWSVPDFARLGRSAPAFAAAAVCATVLLGLAVGTWIQVGYWRDSFSLLEHTLAVTNRNFIAHNNLGYAFSRAGEYHSAIQEFQAVLQINPRYAAAHDNLGNALAATGQLDEAVNQYNKAIELAPRTARPHHNLAAALMKQGKIEPAIEEYHKALALHPGFVSAMIGLGAALTSQGRVDEAIAQLSEALQREPHRAEAHAAMGVALWSKRRVDQAIAEYSIALKLQPKAAETHSNLGLALASAGRLDEAIGQFEEALRLKPDDIAAREYLKLARQQRGEVPK